MENETFCIWWDETADDAQAWYTYCNSGVMTPSQQQLAQALYRDTTAAHCPWCGNRIMITDSISMTPLHGGLGVDNGGTR